MHNTIPRRSKPDKKPTKSRQKHEKRGAIKELVQTTICEEKRKCNQTPLNKPEKGKIKLNYYFPQNTEETIEVKQNTQR